MPLDIPRMESFSIAIKNMAEPKRDHKRYFPRPLCFADYRYNVYPDAIIVPSIETFDADTKTVILKESVYKTRADFDSGLPPISEPDGGIKRVIYRGEQFDAFVAVNAQIIALVAMLIHAIFEARKTVPNPTTGAMDSIFEGAGDVIMPDEMDGKK